MHKDELAELSAAIDGLNKRGRSQSREREARKKPKTLGNFNQQRARQSYTR